MNEALKLIESRKIYKKIFREVYNKYKKYGKITGSFVLKSLSPEDEEVLVNFDQNVIINKKARIKCAVVEELFKRKLNKDESFIELMETVIGSELVTKKEEKAKENKMLQSFLDKIIENSQNGGGKEWFIKAVYDKSFGYNTIIRKYNECKDEVMIDKLINDLVFIINSLCNLPCVNNNKENIAVFSAKMTKDPHFFDYGSYAGNLLVHGLKFIFKKEISNSVNELNELYYEAGLLKDEISNHTTVFGFKAYDEDNKEIEAIRSFWEWKEPLELSMSNLVKIDKLKAVNNEVYIFENPAVFKGVMEESGWRASLICTSGQLNLSSYIIIDKIINLKNIYYAGDFDPEGLLIADKIKERYKDKVKFILYDKSVYEKIRSSKIINESRLASLNKIKSKELIEIKDILYNEKVAAYQELLIDEYINIINS